jgi:diguanylate cyclase (GGDEF)-like protein/PAS domain S-box-containing protein
MTNTGNSFAGTAGCPPIVLPQRWHRVLVALGVTVVYIASAGLGLQLAVVHGNVTAVWPPSGIALAALLLLGTRFWSAIAVAAFLVNLWSGLPWLTSFMLAGGNTLAALTGARLVSHFCRSCNPLDSCMGLLTLVAGGALIATTLSASVGVTALLASGLAPLNATGELWLTWWLGDATGVIVFAPLFLAWDYKPEMTWKPHRFAEGLVYVMALIFTVQVIFSGWFSTEADNDPLAFLMLPVLCWAALRFGRRGTTLVVTLLVVHAIWGTVQGYGPFVHEDLNESLLLLQAFMSVTSLTALMLAVVFHERKIAQQRLEQHQSEIEQRIADRTRELSAANIHLLREVRTRKHNQGMVSSLGQILEESCNEIYIFDASTLEFLNVNQGARHNLGYTPDELEGMTPLDIKPEMSRESFDRRLAPLRDGSLERLGFETVHRRKDGSEYPVEVHLQLTSLGARQVFVAIILDISERHEAGIKLRQATTVFDNSNEGVLVTDANWTITAVNRAFTGMTGHTETDLLGKQADVLKSDRHDKAFLENILATLQDSGRWQGELWHRRENGEAYPHWTSISEVRDDAGRVTNYVHVFTDITAIEGIQERVRHLAYHDPLTALPNRSLFNDRLTHALHNTRRTGKRVAVLFLDLDDFKGINDALGHLPGDELLQQVGRRLVTTVREVDTVSRYGGDEFTIVLEGIEELGHVVSVCERVLHEMAKPFSLGGHRQCISASIGISVFPEDGRNEQSLVECADAAMYQAKRAGGNRFSFYQGGEQAVRSEGPTRKTGSPGCADRESNHLNG